MWADGHSHTDMSSMRQGILVLKPTCLGGAGKSPQAAWGAAGLLTSRSFLGLTGHRGGNGGPSYGEAFYFRWSLVPQDQLSDLG